MRNARGKFMQEEGKKRHRQKTKEETLQDGTQSGFSAHTHLPSSILTFTHHSPSLPPRPLLFRDATHKCKTKKP